MITRNQVCIKQWLVIHVGMTFAILSLSGTVPSFSDMFIMWIKGKIMFEMVSLQVW